MYLSDMISVARRFRTEECSYYPADEFGLMTDFSMAALSTNPRAHVFPDEGIPQK